MRILTLEQPTHWSYWAVGTLCSMAAVASTPVESLQYGSVAIVVFLFLWGLLTCED